MQKVQDQEYQIKLNESVHVIATTVENMYNNCITTGCYPKIFKVVKSYYYIKVNP